MIQLRAGAVVLCLYASWSTAFVALPAVRSPWRSGSMLSRTAKPFDEGGGGDGEAFDGVNAEARRHESVGASDNSIHGASPLSDPEDRPLGSTEVEASSSAASADAGEDSAAATADEGASSVDTNMVEQEAGAAEDDEEEFVTLRYRAQADVGGPSASEAMLAPLVKREKRRAAELAAREAKAKAMAREGGAPSGKWEGAQSRYEEDVLDAAARAHAEFYKALNQRDLGAMRRVWLEGSDYEVQCTHPLFEEFANPESSRDGGLSGKGEYAGRGLFVGGYKPITEAFGKAFKYSNSNKDDRIKRSKTVPINLRARMLGPNSVLVLCTDDITGPAAVGDNSRAPIKVTGTTTALLRKDLERNEWRIAHLHAALCTASGSFNDAQKGSSGSGSGNGPRVIRISSDGSGAISSSGGGSSSSSSARAAEDLGMQIGELIAREMAGNNKKNKGGGDSTESIIEQVLGGLLDDDDDDDDDENDDISGPRIVVVRRGSASDSDDDDDDDDDDEPRSRLRSALGEAIAAASGTSPSSSSSSGGQVLPGGKGFGDSSSSSSSSRRDRSSSRGLGSDSKHQLDRIAASLDQLVALQQAKAAAEGAAAAATARNTNSNDALRRQVQSAAHALEVASRRQRAVAAVRVLARQGEVSAAQKQALLKEVVQHAHESKVAQIEWHRARSTGNSASPGNSAATTGAAPGGGSNFETLSLVEAALEMLLPGDSEQEAVDFQALLTAGSGVSQGESAATVPTDTTSTAPQREDMSLAEQLEIVRRDALNNNNGASSMELSGEMTEFAEQARAVADMLLEEWGNLKQRNYSSKNGGF